MSAVSLLIGAVGVATSSAGGPTSVIVVNPAQSATGALYGSDAEYGALQRALDNAQESERSDEGFREGPGSPETINVTWLIHDVMVWRVDRVNIDDAGLVWVKTYDHTSDGGTLDWDRKAEWRMVPDSPDVLAIFKGMGVLGATAEAADVTAELADRAGLPAPSSSDDGSGLGWWVWGLAGVVAGVVLAVGSRPAMLAVAGAVGRAKHRASDRGPRQEFIDLR